MPGTGTAIWLLLALLATGCAYTRDRLMDLTDIVDLKYGLTQEGAVPLGLGVKARATEFVGANVTMATCYDDTEWYGRRKFTNRGSQPWSILLFGGDRTFDPPEELYLLIYRKFKPWPQPLSLVRVGGEVVLPFVRGGIFVNVGEILDFVLGFMTLDPAQDDGLPKGADLDARAGDEEEDAEAWR